MLRFVRDVLFFLALQGIVLAWIWHACPRRDDHYAAATIDKRRLLAQTPPPRVIAVGGSSVSFGFDSRPWLGGGLAPVNMGHDRGLGLPFMLAQVRDALAPGDLVVVSPEYELLFRPAIDGSVITYLEHDPSSVRYIGFDTGRRLCDQTLPWIARKLRCALHQVSTDPQLLFSRASFDEYGDFAAHRGLPPRPHRPLPIDWPSPETMDVDRAIALLDDFAAHCRVVGAHCVFAFAPLRRSEYDSARASADRLDERFAATLDLPIVLSVAAAVVPDADFFDAGPHLTEPAARRRTVRLQAAVR